MILKMRQHYSWVMNEAAQKIKGLKEILDKLDHAQYYYNIALDLCSEDGLEDNFKRKLFVDLAIFNKSSKKFSYILAGHIKRLEKSITTSDNI